MQRVCNMNVKITEQEAKYYRRVFRFTSIQVLVSFFLLGVIAVSNLVAINYMMSVLALIFTVYFLYIIKTCKVGTKSHLRAGILLIGTYIFYGFDRLNIILATTIAFAVFITYINGRELQTKVTNNS